MTTMTGKLLLSSGSLFDPNFRQTVVLLAAHDADGAVGVVLNRPLEVAVGAAVPVLSELAGSATRLFHGGPVEPDGAVLLVDVEGTDVLDVPVFGTIGFLTGEVSAEVRSAVRRVRVFVGYAGWGPGQLEAELEEDSWIVADAAVDDVFAETPETLWADVLKRMGPPYARLARMPFDPTLN